MSNTARHPATPHVPPRLVCMLAYADAQSLDITGPLEVFSLASRQAQEDHPEQPPLYDVRIVARHLQPVTVASSMRILPDIACDALPEHVDTLLVNGGMGDALIACVTMSGWSVGCGRPRPVSAVSARSAVARCCWPSPACWMDARPPPTGAMWRN
jgi:hypothetical protein